MKEIERQILELFDACPTRQQMTGLANMYNVSMKNLTAFLKKQGREIPPGSRGPKPKHENAKVIVMAADTAEETQRKADLITKMPDCVAKTIEKRMHELEDDIKNYQEAIRNYEDMVSRLEAEYTAHANYLLNCPFEQRDLSQCSSDNMIESPQPVG